MYYANLIDRFNDSLKNLQMPICIFAMLNSRICFFLLFTVFKPEERAQKEISSIGGIGTQPKKNYKRHTPNGQSAYNQKGNDVKINTDRFYMGLIM